MPPGPPFAHLLGIPVEELLPGALCLGVAAVAYLRILVSSRRRG